MNFPSTSSPDDPYLRFADSDNNRAYFDAFDQAGIKIWLQVEPGQADIPTLIDLVLSRYGRHPCVAGFGIDIEWYQQDQYFEGKAISDEKAQTWSSQVRSYNQDYILFLKHWLPEKMPPDYRQGLVFVDDSQKFITLNEMAAEFEHWGNTFSPSPVAFQFGYKSDQRWWGEYNDPPLEIGKLLLSRIPNLAGLFWVDFTAAELWPVPPSN